MAVVLHIGCEVYPPHTLSTQTPITWITLNLGKCLTINVLRTRGCTPGEKIHRMLRPVTATNFIKNPPEKFYRKILPVPEIIIDSMGNI